MSVSRSRESTIKRHTASMARALAWLKNTSSCTVPESVFTTITPVRIPRYAQSERGNEHAAGQRQNSRRRRSDRLQSRSCASDTMTLGWLFERSGE